MISDEKSFFDITEHSVTFDDLNFVDFNSQNNKLFYDETNTYDFYFQKKLFTHIEDIDTKLIVYKNKKCISKKLLYSIYDPDDAKLHYFIMVLIVNWENSEVLDFGKIKKVQPYFSIQKKFLPVKENDNIYEPSIYICAIGKDLEPDGILSLFKDNIFLIFNEKNLIKYKEKAEELKVPFLYRKLDNEIGIPDGRLSDLDLEVFRKQMKQLWYKCKLYYWDESRYPDHVRILTPDNNIFFREIKNFNGDSKQVKEAIDSL